MRLTVCKDGYGYAPNGVRYWRGDGGHWHRVIGVRIETVKHFTYWPYFVGGKPVTRVAYQYGDQNGVYMTEYVKAEPA